MLLHKIADIVQPTRLAKLLMAHGLTLRGAHEAVNALTAAGIPDEGVPVSLVVGERLESELKALGLTSSCGLAARGFPGRARRE